MATNVRLKDAAGNILHPETDWSVVQNRPNIIISGFQQTWSSVGLTIEGVGVLTLKSDNVIQVSDKNTSGSSVDLSNYPIKWSVISGRPKNTNLFGYVKHTAGNSSYEEKWPAVAIRNVSDTITSVYQFTGSGWTTASKDSFIEM